MFISPVSDDYSSTLSSSTVTIDSSTSTVYITFCIVDDTFYELAEILFAVLNFAPGGANSMVVLSPNRAQVNILDDDGMFEFFKLTHKTSFQVTCAITFEGIIYLFY